MLFYVFTPLADPEAIRLWQYTLAEANNLTGRILVSEHGIGQVLTEEMALFKPAVEIDLMRGIKRLLDPHDLFNPGRLLPAPLSTTTTTQRPPVAKELQ